MLGEVFRPGLIPEGNIWGDDPNGGMEDGIFSQICFGPKVSPKASFFMKIGPADAENHKESENRTAFSPKPLKKQEILKFRYGECNVCHPREWFILPNVPFSQYSLILGPRFE